jgi:hypothetical protein
LPLGNRLRTSALTSLINVRFSLSAFRARKPPFRSRPSPVVSAVRADPGSLDANTKVGIFVGIFIDPIRYFCQKS